MPSSAFKPVRIVQIGTGGFGKYHLKTWQNIPEGEVIGVYDVSTEAAEKAAETYGVERVYESLEEALGDKRAEAVTVVVPNRFHADIAIQAMEAGKHCLCEKPIAPNAKEVERIIKARDRCKKLLMTGQHMRFYGKTAALRKLIAAGKLGDVYYARASWLRRRGVPATPGFISEKLAARGPGADLGVHVVDLALHLMGRPKPTRVSGLSGCKLAKTPGRHNDWGAYEPDDYTVEDFAAGWVRFANGAVLNVEVSWMLNMPESETYGVELFGEQGGAQWPSLRWVHEEDGLLSVAKIEGAAQLDLEGHAGEFAAFCKAVRTGGPSPVPAEESLEVARVLDALYESAKKGREIEL